MAELQGVSASVGGLKLKGWKSRGSSEAAGTSRPKLIHGAQVTARHEEILAMGGATPFKSVLLLPKRLLPISFSATSVRKGIEISLPDGSKRVIAFDALRTLLEQSAQAPLPLFLEPSSIDVRAARFADLLLKGGDVHWSLQGGRVPDKPTLFRMARKLLARLERKEKLIVPHDDAEAFSLQAKTYKLFAEGKISVSIDCPGFPFLLDTIDVLLMNSWFRSSNRVAIFNKEGLYTIDHANRRKLLVGPPNRGRVQGLRHGVRKDDSTLCVSLAFDAFVGEKIAATGPPPMYADGTPAHKMTEDFNKKQSSKIDDDMIYALSFLRQALKKRRAALTQGADNRDAVSKLIIEEQPFVAEMPCAAVAELVPAFKSNLNDHVGQRLGSMALLLDEESDNLLTVFTCFQMGSTLCNPSTMHRSANMYFHFFHEFTRAFILFAGGPEDAMAPFNGVSTSELAALIRTPGDAAFNDLLHRQGMLAPTDRYVCPSVAGGEHGGEWSPYDVLEKHGVSIEQASAWAEAVRAAALVSAQRRGEVLRTTVPQPLQAAVSALAGSKWTPYDVLKKHGVSIEQASAWAEAVRAAALVSAQRRGEVLRTTVPHLLQAAVSALAGSKWTPYPSNLASVSNLLALRPNGMAAVLAAAKPVLLHRQLAPSRFVRDVMKNQKLSVEDVVAMKEFKEWMETMVLSNPDVLLAEVHRLFGGWINVLQRLRPGDSYRL